VPSRPARSSTEVAVVFDGARCEDQAHRRMSNGKQGLVFISCGQYRSEEIQLGQDLAKAANELTNFEGYFAQNQASLDGLSQHIFGALNRCTGFVGVMHHRGTVTTPHGELVRASVWVEQELAIAAFLRQAQQRQLAVVVYIQKGIQREGVRDKLLLGAVEFETEAEVLTDFKARLTDGRFGPVRLTPPRDAEIRIAYTVLSRSNAAAHQYRLQVFVLNAGTEPLTDYWVEVQFPKWVLESSRTYVAEVGGRQTASHRLFRATRQRTRRDIYPGDELLLLSIDYYMDHHILHNKGSVLDEPVTASFGSPGMAAKRVEKPFRELQDFDTAAPKQLPNGC
jgi:hypothetical protein